MGMSTLPLITHTHADSIVAWRDGKPISAAAFLADVRQVSAMLPASVHLLNACADRYRFMVGLAASVLSNKISLLPPTQTPEMIGQMQQFAPDAFCLTDSEDCSVALPQVRFPQLVSETGTETEVASRETFSVPFIDAAQIMAYVFTSGSTGQPRPHVKTWGGVAHSVCAEAQRWGIADGRSHAIIGTVPPQHMYGLESTVVIVMQSANAMVTGQHFYPADICSALEKVPAPRVLVSTPIHLRFLLEATGQLPEIGLLVSATAPLSLALAQEVERRCHAPLVEIYGCTETGQIASRRLTEGEEWHLFPDIRFRQENEITLAYGGHIDQPTEMGDVIEMVSEDRFRLHGRKADMVNIAGKRNSLAYLNLQLTAIEGVLDGAFFVPDEADSDELVRLVAFVVAPSLSSVELMAALRKRIDAVFLPRPLVFVDALPRNSTGKLPRSALQALLAQTMNQSAGRAT